MRIVGLDPGICNLFFAISLNGERFRYSLGEYRAHAKSEAYASRTAAWVRAAVPALPQLPAVRRPYLSIRRAYSDVVLENLDTLLNFYGSLKFRHASLNVRNAPGRPPAAAPPRSITSHVRPWLRMHTQIHFRKRAAVVRGAKRLTDPLPGDVDGRLLLTVVLYGDGNFNTSMRGNPPSSHLCIRKELEQMPCVKVLDADERYSSTVRTIKPRSSRRSVRAS